MPRVAVSGLMSMWRPVTSDVPEGSVLGPVLVNIFVMGSGIEGTFSKSADSTELCGAVSTWRGRDGIQRDLNRLERWDCANLMEFNKCKVLHVGKGNPRNTHRSGREVFGSSSMEKNLVGGS